MSSLYLFTDNFILVQEMGHLHSNLIDSVVNSKQQIVLWLSRVLRGK